MIVILFIVNCGNTEQNIPKVNDAPVELTEKLNKLKATIAKNKLSKKEVDG